MKRYKSIVLSDLHVGSQYARHDKIIKFLKATNAENYFLNGDIIDFTRIKKGRGLWNKQCSEILGLLVEKSKKSNVTYMLGNHEKMFRSFLPFNFGQMSIVNSHVYVGVDGRTYYFFHGDKIKVKHNNLSESAGNFVYDEILIKIDAVYNSMRKALNLDYKSLASAAKETLRVIKAIEEDFKCGAESLVKVLGYDVAVCGHIHMPCVSEHYMNSGDFAGGSTALVEDFAGSWSLIHV